MFVKYKIYYKYIKFEFNYNQNGNLIRFWCVRKFLEWAGRKDLVSPKLTAVDVGKQALAEEEVDKICNLHHRNAFAPSSPCILS